MKALNKNKYISWLVILLAVLNIALLVFIWSGQKRFGKNPPPGGMILLEERLQLEPAQIRQLKQLRETHFQKIDALRKDSREARKTLHSLWSQANVNEKVNDLTQRLGTTQAAIEKATYQHFAQIRAICTPQQQEIFDTIIEDVLRKGDRPGGKDGRRPPPKGRR